ncbi:MAG: carboxymuconolactone decarboxylase family protein [Deferribacterales bacterium]
MGELMEKRENNYKLVLELLDQKEGMKDAMLGLMSTAYTDGALPEYVKRLMALTGALVHGCEGCILSQALRALDKGATAEQVMEACYVAVSLGGTMAVAESTKVFRLLKEKGLV